MLTRQPVGWLQEEDRKELSLRAIIGMTPEEQEKAVGAAADAEQKYKQAGHAAADQAEAGVDKATAQVQQAIRLACMLVLVNRITHGLRTHQGLDCT